MARILLGNIKGAQGPEGTRGSKTFCGVHVHGTDIINYDFPPGETTLVKNDDFYFNSDTGNLYKATRAGYIDQGGWQYVTTMPVTSNVGDIKEMINTLSDDVDTRLSTLKNDIAIVESTLGYSNKNIISNNIESTQTISGLTFDKHAKQSIYVTGTSTGAGNLVIWKGKLSAGEYIVSDMSNVTKRVEIGDHLKIRIHDYTNDVTLGELVVGDKEKIITTSIDRDVEIYLNWNIVGCEYLGYIYPMLRRAEIIDGTYEPHVDDINTRLNGELICQGKISDGEVSCDFTPYKTITCYLYHTGYVFSITIHTEMIADYETRIFISGYNKGYAQFNLNKYSIAIGGLRFDDIDNPNPDAPFYVFGHK